MPKRLILASASPRRRELLALLGLPFETVTADIDESAYDDLAPQAMVRRLSEEKAREGWDRCRKPSVFDDLYVLGADTIVVVNDQDVLGKPADEAEARSMLALLSGSTHTVYTGLYLVYGRVHRQIEAHVTEVCDTQVQFRQLTPAMIDSYIATGEPFDKAGAYGIQGYASAFVEAVYGDYFNVVGLPVQTVGRMLEKAGIEWWRGEVALI